MDFCGHRNRPTVGPSTQRDPIGLAGGLNQYGYAGGDPVNYSDPFGLCKKARSDGRKCNHSTGDKNLDDPDTRQRMEDSYNEATTDNSGYKNEHGGACNTAGHCLLSTGDREEVFIRYPNDGEVAYDWHSHGNEGRPRPGASGEIYGYGASSKDRRAVRDDYKQGRRHPSYIVGAEYIYVLTPNERGRPVVTRHRRFER